MKKKLLAAFLAAAMAVGLASATFAYDYKAEDTNSRIEIYIHPDATEIVADGDPIHFTYEINAQTCVSDPTTGGKVWKDVEIKDRPTWEVWDDKGEHFCGLTIDENGVLSADPALAEQFKEETYATVTARMSMDNLHVEAVAQIKVKPPAVPVYGTGVRFSGLQDVHPGSEFVLTAAAGLSDGSAYTGAWDWTIKSAHGKGISMRQNGNTATITVAKDVPVGTAFEVGAFATDLEKLQLPEGIDNKVGASVEFIVEENYEENPATPGGSTSSGSDSSSGSTAAPAAEETVSAAEATAKTERAIEAAAKADPDAAQVVVKVKNAKSITAAALKAVAKAAEKAEKAPVIHADVVKDGKVESRLYIDPALVKGNDEIKLGVTLGDEKVEAKFASFKKDMAIVKFDQAGSFGMNIKAAVKLDLSKLNTKTLVFYNYNPKTNRYSKMSVKDYRIDANGYLHFTTSVGNYVLVTDELLKK